MYCIKDNHVNKRCWKTYDYKNEIGKNLKKWQMRRNEIIVHSKGKDHQREETAYRTGNPEVSVYVGLKLERGSRKLWKGDVGKKGHRIHVTWKQKDGLWGWKSDTQRHKGGAVEWIRGRHAIDLWQCITKHTHSALHLMKLI